MRDPLFNLDIAEEIGLLQASFVGWDRSAEKIVVLEQAFTAIDLQEHIADLCGRFCADAGVRLIAVEGADGKVEPVAQHSSVKDLVLRTPNQVSAGVLAYLNAHPNEVEVYGVDQMEIRQQSIDVMNTLTSNEKLRERVFTLIRRMLQTARRRYYPPEISRLREGTMLIDTWRKNDLDLNKRISLIEHIAHTLQVSLDEYAFMHGYSSVQRLEAQFNLGRVKRQRAEFIRRLVNHTMGGWYTVKKQREGAIVQFDIDKANPLVAFWAEMTGMTQEELARQLEIRGIEEVLLSMRQWYTEWLTSRVLDERTSLPMKHVGFYEELMRLALRTSVPYFDLLDFRRYVVYLRRIRDLGMPDLRMLAEIDVCTSKFVRRLASTEAQDLFDLEEQFKIIYDGLVLGLDPTRAETAVLTPGHLTVIINRLAALAGEHPPADMRSDITKLDSFLAQAKAFTQLSQSRGRHMVAELFRLMQSRGEDRALFVVGGFHRRETLDLLEDKPGISWELIMPQMNAAQHKKIMSKLPG